LTTAVLTMILTPIISSQTSRLYALKKKWFQKEPLESINIPKQGFDHHVVIAGGGRVGLQIATTLHRLGQSFVLIELDQRRIEQAKEAGFAVIYGDAGQEIVLEAASISRAGLLVVTIPGIVVAQTIVRHAQRITPKIEVVARLSDPEFFNVFSELQVTDLVYPELEAGLEMARQVLLALKVPVTEIQRQTEALRQEYFVSSMSQTKPYQTLTQFRSAEQEFDLEWVHLTGKCRLCNFSIGDSEIRKKTGVSVVGVLREDQLEPNPGPQFCLREKDMVAIIGSGEARQNFHTTFLGDEPLLTEMVSATS